MTQPVLVVPGIGNSGPEHWQSLWEQQHAALVRVGFDEWDKPDRHDWVATLDATVRALGPETVIVAHSLGCLAVAHWAAVTQTPVAGALLVCVPDPDGKNFPAEASNFSALPQQPFAFPSVIVASDDDPYSNPAHVDVCAHGWGSRVVSIGAHGHINASSGLGDWPQGWQLLQGLLAESA